MLHQFTFIHGGQNQVYKYFLCQTEWSVRLFLTMIGRGIICITLLWVWYRGTDCIIMLFAAPGRIWGSGEIAIMIDWGTCNLDWLLSIWCLDHYTNDGTSLEQPKTVQKMLFWTYNEYLVQIKLQEFCSNGHIAELVTRIRNKRRKGKILV